MCPMLSANSESACTKRCPKRSHNVPDCDDGEQCTLQHTQFASCTFPSYNVSSYESVPNVRTADMDIVGEVIYKGSIAFTEMSTLTIHRYNSFAVGILTLYHHTYGYVLVLCIMTLQLYSYY